MLRLPDGMRARIAKAAAHNNRSMNAEIVASLSGYYPPEPDAKDIAEQIDLFLSWATVRDMPFVRSDGRTSLISGLKELKEAILREETEAVEHSRPNKLREERE